MLRLFNSFQIVAFFAAAPYGISWLSSASFPASGVAFWMSLGAYAIYFAMMIAAVFAALEE